MANDHTLTRFGLLAAIALSIAMMAGHVYFSSALPSLPGGTRLVAETTIALLAYGTVVAWATTGPRYRGTTLRPSTFIGVLAATIMIADQIVGLTRRLEGETNAILTITFMGCTFFFWGAAGYLNFINSRRIAASAIGGSWSAMVMMSIVVAVGFLIEFYVATPKPEYVATWQEFKRSGWSDVGAFTTANTLDSALTHLLIGPVVGAVVGSIGGLVRLLVDWVTNDTLQRRS